MNTRITYSKIQPQSLAAHTESRRHAAMHMEASLESRLSNFHSAAEMHKQEARGALDVAKGVESRLAPANQFVMPLEQAVYSRRNASYN